MRNILNTAVVVLAALSLAACYDTDDNSKYGADQALEINGMAALYELQTFVDVLRIDPKVTAATPDPSFEYTWQLYGAGDKTADMDTISTAGVLEYPVLLKPGSYTLVLDVVNTRNGLHTQASAGLTVISEFSRGFYLLKEADGGTDMDLHKPDGSVVENVITKSMGAKLAGTPVSMGLLCFYPFYNTEIAAYERTQALGVCTSKGASIFNLADLGEIYDYDTMFYIDPPVEKPLYMTYTYFGTLFLTDGAAYWTAASEGSTRPGSGKFGYPRVLAGDYSPNVNAIYNQYLYFFDELNGRFCYTNHNGAIYAFPYDEDTEYLPTGIMHDLVHFGRNKVGMGTSTATGYALFEDRQESGKMYLYTIDISTTAANNMITAIDEIGDMDFNKAGCYATNELDAHIIYFSVGGQLYYYDILEKAEHKLSPAGFGGEQIVFIRNKFWTQADDEDYNFNHLVIGTYSSGTYKVYMYNTLGGIPTGSPVHILEGSGKPLHMQYASPMLNAGSNAQYSYYPGSY